ncbi:hypothetical protein KA119_00790 [Candidatus Gracilibacteria bacterium]|nr:hypothetical protein [Candidatus Gracilibacteria bacterium]
MSTNDAKAVVVDKNKSAEDYLKEAAAFYIVPDLVRDEFPDLVKLIYETESMDQEEREYWLQIMPIMSKEQIEKFRGILTNERDQLANLGNQGGAAMAEVASPVMTEEEMHKRMAVIAEKEAVAENEEKAREEEILKQLEAI